MRKGLRQDLHMRSTARFPLTPNPLPQVITNTLHITHMSNNIKVKVGDKVKLNQTGIGTGLNDECWYGAGTEAIKTLQADPDREWTVCYVDSIDKSFRLVGLGFFWTLDVFDIIPLTVGQRLKRIFNRK